MRRPAHQAMVAHDMISGRASARRLSPNFPPNSRIASMDQLALPKPIPTAFVIALTLIIWFVIPVPAGVTSNAWHLFALFTGTIVAIIGKVMPIGALAVIAIALVAITGVTNPGKPAQAQTDSLSGFANPLIWLIVAAVMVSLSLNKTGL